MLPKDEVQAEAPRVHHPEYERAVKDVIVWLLKNADEFKPEYVPRQIARDFL
jgi:hypothetical protein